MTVKVHIWDWPLRLFHWLLVLAVVGSYVTGKLGGSLTEWHGRLGGLVLGLLIFRLIWGFIGSDHARFISFFPTLPRLVAYLKGEWQGAGHNPVGALAVFALLSVLIFLVITGLFANDDIGFEGPLYPLVDKALSDKLSGKHVWAINILIGLVGLHIVAILFYQHIKKADLIAPMLTGKKRLPKNLAPRSIKPIGGLRFLIGLLISVSVVWGIWDGGFVHYLSPLANAQPLALVTSSKS